MRRTIISLATGLLLVACVPATEAQAQLFGTGAADSARVGQRVKLMMLADTITGHPRQILFGQLRGRSADSLSVDLGRGVPMVVVPVDAVDRMYVSRGVPTRQQSAIGGAIGGAVVGAGFGLLLMIISDANAWDLIQHTFFDAALGAGLGALMPQESWKRVQR